MSCCNWLIKGGHSKFKFCFFTYSKKFGSNGSDNSQDGEH